jgi:hypothetical protein
MEKRRKEEEVVDMKVERGSQNKGGSGRSTQDKRMASRAPMIRTRREGQSNEGRYVWSEGRYNWAVCTRTTGKPKPEPTRDKRETLFTLIIPVSSPYPS